MILLTIWTLRRNVGLRAKVTNLVSLYLPLVLGGVGLAWYNWARFGSIAETVSSFLIAFFLLTLYFWAGIRYLGDFISPLTVLSALGFGQGYQFSSHKLFIKNVYIFCGVLLAGISILTSILLAISTNSALTNLILHRFPFPK